MTTLERCPTVAFGPEAFAVPFDPPPSGRHFPFQRLSTQTHKLTFVLDSPTLRMVVVRGGGFLSMQAGRGQIANAALRAAGIAHVGLPHYEGGPLSLRPNTEVDLRSLAGRNELCALTAEGSAVIELGVGTFVRLCVEGECCIDLHGECYLEYWGGGGPWHYRITGAEHLLRLEDLAPLHYPGEQLAGYRAPQPLPPIYCGGWANFSLPSERLAALRRVRFLLRDGVPEFWLDGRRLSVALRGGRYLLFDAECSALAYFTLDDGVLTLAMLEETEPPLGRLDYLVF